MDSNDLKLRTKQLSLRILKLVAHLAAMRDPAVKAIASQLVRCGTSVGANYRAACRSRSRAEFLARLGVVEEEADETCYWLELLQEGGFVSGERIEPLHGETDELVAIVSAARKTTRSSLKSQIANRKSKMASGQNL